MASRRYTLSLVTSVRRGNVVRLSIPLCSCLVLALLAAGCTTSEVRWRKLDQPTPVKPHDVVWIWSHAALDKWQAVVFTHDSISGIPLVMPLKCDSCRRSLPLAQVDSMRLGYEYHNVHKQVFVAAGVLTLALVVEYVVCSLAHEHGCG